MDAAWKVMVLVCLIVLAVIAIGNEIDKILAIEAARIASARASISRVLEEIGAERR